MRVQQARGYVPLTNITDREFILKVDWVEQAVLQPWETITVLAGHAELGANHMAQDMVIKEDTERLFDLMNKTLKREDELWFSINFSGWEKYNEYYKRALWKKAVVFDWLTRAEVEQIARDKWIKLKANGKEKTKDQLISELKIL